MAGAGAVAGWLCGVRFAVRGLWWRRGLSAAVLAVAALVIGIAAAGPIYDRAAKQSVLQSTLRGAPANEVGLEVAGSGSVGGLIGPLRAHLRGAHADLYGTAVTARELSYDGPLGCAVGVPSVGSGCNAPVAGMVVARDGAFAHLRIVGGRLPARAGEVVASVGFLTANGLRVGDRLAPSGPTFTIVGSWQADESDPYWFGRPYFAGLGPGGEGADPYQDALFTMPATLSLLPAYVVIDLPLTVSRVRVGDAAHLRTAVSTLQALSGGAFADLAAPVSTLLPAVLTAAAANEHSLGTPILLIVLQLVLLCGLVLIGAVRAAAEARGPEVALAALRRAPRAAVVVFGLAESVLLVPLALPLGLLAAWVAARGLAAGQLLAGTPVVLPLDALWAALVAVAGSVAATVWIGLRIVRRPPSAQWRRATQRSGGRSWWVDALVVAVAVGALVWLLVSGGLKGLSGQQASRAGAFALLAPALLALAVAMAGSRLLPAASRALYGFTRRRGASGFLAVRQIARRPTTLTATVLLTVALALASFAISAATVATTNRHAVAGTSVGAATVVEVTVPRGVDLAAAVDRADPTGRSAMAVTTAVSTNSRLLIGVQPSRFAGVAYWRSDFARGVSPTVVARRLNVPGLHVVTVTGTQLALDLRVAGLRGAPVIRPAVTLTGPSGPISVTGPPLPADGAKRVVVDVPDCRAGCRLTGVGVQREDQGITNLAGTLTVTGLAQRSVASAPWAPVPGALAGGAGGWRVQHADAGTSALATKAGALAYTFDLPWQDQPQIAPHDLPAALPAAVSFPVPNQSPTPITGFDGQSLAIVPTTDAVALPRVGAAGALVDRTLALRAAGPGMSEQNEVWLAAGADPAILRRIAAAGISLGADQTIGGADASLAHQGPPLALALFRVGAVLAAILALLGTGITVALTARRRAFELSALRVMGLSRRVLWRSLAVEQTTLLGYGALLGVGTGLVAALAALPSVPEFVQPPTSPPLLFSPPYLLVVGIAAGIAAVIVLASTVGSAVLVRSAGPERLREYVP